MKVYISGPMSGYPDLNFPAFHAAEAALAARGYQVVNPARLNPPERPWHLCLREDLRELLLCDGVALLDGWEKSRGARCEMVVASIVEIPSCTLAEALRDGPFGWPKAGTPQRVPGRFTEWL